MSGLDTYSFVFRGSLAQHAIDAELSALSERSEDFSEQLRQRLPFDLLDADIVRRARAMAEVYALIAAFENSARKFIAERLLEEHKETWWEDCVPNKIRAAAEQRKVDEEQNRYHGTRGQSMIHYCQLGDLHSILQNNFDKFSDYLPSIDWVSHIIRAVERSRNVIMHAGDLSMQDIERVAMNVRDWLRQVGG